MVVTRKRPKANQTTSTVLTTTTTQYAGEITSVTNNSYTLSGASGSATIASIYQSGPNGPISYNLGNGLSQFSSYDTLGRMSGGWVCIGAPSLGCPNQHYGFVRNMTGSRINGSTQDYVGTGITYQYDDFNRLSGMQTSSGVAPYSYTYSYNYDRYGNRWQQNASGGATFSQSFNPKNNQIVSSSYQYDAAGHMTNDSFNRYTYDAEGNILTVGNGQTATYVYNALNQKVKSVTSSGVLEFLFDPQGRQTSVWTASPNATASESHIYNDSTQFAFRSGDGHTYFIHKDWVNSDRVHTDLNGATAAVYTKLPFGDGGSATVSETDGGWDFGRFGDMDYNGETNTYHAQFRQYSQAQGRWLSPDPYDGSYDASNPQSFNRYSYALNNPLSLVDPTGTDADDPNDPCNQYNCVDAGSGWPCATYGGCGCTADACVNAPYPSDPPPPPDPIVCIACVAGTPSSGGGSGGTTPTPKPKPASGNTSCQLLAPGGNYNLGPNAVALFQPQMSAALTNAFNFLNSQGVTPTINSGYRSPADQIRMQNGGSGPNPAATVSWHQAGMAVDINGTTSSFFPTIISAMQAQGLTWGGTFTHRDPPHFQLPPPGTRPSAATVTACAATAGGH